MKSYFVKFLVFTFVIGYFYGFHLDNVRALAPLSVVEGFDNYPLAYLNNNIAPNGETWTAGEGGSGIHGYLVNDDFSSSGDQSLRIFGGEADSSASFYLGSGVVDYTALIISFDVYISAWSNKHTLRFGFSQDSSLNNDHVVFDLDKYEDTFSIIFDDNSTVSQVSASTTSAVLDDTWYNMQLLLSNGNQEIKARFNYSDWITYEPATFNLGNIDDFIIIMNDNGPSSNKIIYLDTLIISASANTEDHITEVIEPLESSVYLVGDVTFQFTYYKRTDSDRDKVGIELIFPQPVGPGLSQQVSFFEVDSSAGSYTFATTQFIDVRGNAYWRPYLLDSSNRASSKITTDWILFNMSDGTESWLGNATTSNIYVSTTTNVEGILSPDDAYAWCDDRFTSTDFTSMTAFVLCNVGVAFFNPSDTSIAYFNTSKARLFQKAPFSYFSFLEEQITAMEYSSTTLSALDPDISLYGTVYQLELGNIATSTQNQVKDYIRMSMWFLFVLFMYDKILNVFSKRDDN